MRTMKSVSQAVKETNNSARVTFPNPKNSGALGVLADRVDTRVDATVASGT